MSDSCNRTRLWLALLVAAGCGTVIPALAITVSEAGEPKSGQSGQFNTGCDFSHRAPDDPIVTPGKPGKAHLHDFVGARTTDAFSTYRSLRRSATSCDRPGDRSAYWVPTALDAGRRLLPEDPNVYYRAARREPTSIRPFPRGLRMIAGDAKRQGAQPSKLINWDCERATPVQRTDPSSGSPTRSSAAVPTCPEGSRLELLIRFPSCWDGVHTDSRDHKSHMAYAEFSRRSRYYECPRSHPVPVPQLAVKVRYPTTGGPDVRLSSGPGYTAHADFFEAWDRRVLAKLVRDCLNADGYCGKGSKPPKPRG